MKEYKFKFQNTKGGFYFLTALLGIPFLIIFSGFFLLKYVSWIFWVNIPLGIALIIYCIRKFIIISKGIEVITLDNEGFTSKSYGRIRYSDIHSIPPYGILQAPPPSMRIKLHNGKKIAWLFNPDSPKLQDDIQRFTEFREELLEQLKRHTKPTENTTAILSSTTKLHYNRQEEATVPKQVIEQLENHKKRDFKYKYLAIPFGAAFGILMFLKTCGTNIIKEHKANEFAGVRNTILKIETDYQSNVEKAMNTARQYARVYGPVFLFTNDPQAKIEFIPDIRRDPYEPEIPLIGIGRVADNEKLESYIAHPDSATYLLTVQNPSLNFSTIMTKSIFMDDEEATAVVYFAVYNPKKSLPSKYKSVEDTTFQPIRYTSSINLPTKGKLNEEILKNMDFASVRSILQLYDGTYFYMAVKEKDGVSTERFNELKELVTANFKQYNIDPNQFQTMRFNNN